MKFTTAVFLNTCFPTIMENNDFYDVREYSKDLVKYSNFEHRWGIINEKRLGLQKEACILMLAMGFPNADIVVRMPKAVNKKLAKLVKTKMATWYAYCGEVFKNALHWHGPKQHGQLFLAATNHPDLLIYLFESHDELASITKDNVADSENIWDKLILGAPYATVSIIEVRKTFNYLKYQFNFPGHEEDPYPERSAMYRLVQTLTSSL